MIEKLDNPDVCDHCGGPVDEDTHYQSGNTMFCSALCLYEFFTDWQEGEDDRQTD